MPIWTLGERFAVLQPGWIPVALLFLALWLWYRRPRRGSDWARYLSPEVLHFLGGKVAKNRQLDVILPVAALSALALASPAVKQADVLDWRHGSGWIAVADLSRSMTLDDIVPSRLGAMRDVLTTLSNEAGARPLALVVFAGDAFLVVPPAFDRQIFRQHVATLEHGLIPQEGSNLARALSLTDSVIEDSELAAVRIVLLGDTGGTGRQAIAAARHLRSRGHRLDQIVFGLQGETDNTSVSGDEVTSSPVIDLDAADSLAESGGGRWIQANALGQVELEDLALSSNRSLQRRAGLESLVWERQSHWLLLLALPLLLLEFRRRY